MSISLPPDIEEFIRGEVASGRYDSVDDVLHEAINIPDPGRIAFNGR